MQIPMPGQKAKTGGEKRASRSKRRDNRGEHRGKLEDRGKAKKKKR